MMAFPSTLLQAAQDAGMDVPELDEGEEFDHNKYPHFAVFCNMQLGRSIQWGEHWENAKIIAKIPKNKIKTTTRQQLLDLGVMWE